MAKVYKAILVWNHSKWSSWNSKCKWSNNKSHTNHSWLHSKSRIQHICLY